MLAYRHQFHAGAVADVIKHALLAQLVLALAKKIGRASCRERV